MIPRPKMALITVLAIMLNGHGAIAGLINNPKSDSTQPSSQVIADLPLPPDTGTPDGQRTPGGTRPELTVACKQTNQPLTALVPENGKGLTTEEHPVFWFYIPYTPKDVHSVEFSIHNQDETTTLYRTSVQLSKTPGVMGVPLPASSKHALKLSQSYHWYLIVSCEPTTTLGTDIVLDGWVTRVQRSPSFDGQVSVVWHDGLTNLAKRYLAEPQNSEVKDAWGKLLKSIGLEGLAQAHLISPAYAP